MRKTFTAPLEKFDTGLYLYHVKVPKMIYNQFAREKITRIICRYNDSYPVHNAFLSAGQAQYYIKLSKETMKEMGLELGDKITVDVQEDDSKYGMPLPVEMEEVLLQDPEGAEIFDALTPGKIRSLLFRINGFKTSNTKIEKSVIIIEHLKANNGHLDWKMLIEAWKTGL